MAIEVAIIVADAPPLITLAAAHSLDYLLYPALPVIIPDAVFHEATQAAGKLGAQEILDWYRAHTETVRVEPTQIFEDEMTLRENPGHRPARDLGERAALEIIRYFPLAENARALLLSDDRDAERLVAIEPTSTRRRATHPVCRRRDRGGPASGPPFSPARSVERSRSRSSRRRQSGH
jgi:hypothetical protein